MRIVIKNNEMKNLLTKLLILISISSIWAQENKGVRFQSKVSPEKLYKTETLSSMEMEFSMKMNDNDKSENTEKDSDLSSTKMQNKMKVETSMVTGKFDGDKFPLVINYDVMEMSQVMNEEEIPTDTDMFKGVQVMGHSTEMGKINIDSITGNLEAELQVFIREVIDITNRVSFPEKEIKVGESFKQEIPISTPVPGVGELNMLGILKYELKEIKDNVAYFDVKESYEMEEGTELKDAAVTMNGEGDGKMEYDMKEHYIVSYESETVMDMIMNMGNGAMTIKNKTNTISKQKVSIEDIK